MPAGKLDVELLERFYARLRRCRKLCSGSANDHRCHPLSPSSVRQIHFILRAAFDRGMRWRYLADNEVARAEPPSVERPDPDPPSADEVAAMLNDAWQDSSWGTLLWFSMVTGCRRGEVCALRWSDLDLERGVVNVERSYAQTRKGTWEKTTKTHQKRRVAVDEYTVDLLTAYRAQREDECAALGIDLSRTAFVFSASPDGLTALLPSTVTQKYRRLARRVGLRSTRLHALRHYSATELLTAGVDLRTVAGRLGHGSGGATTLRFYSAWVGEADRRAADTLSNVMPRPQPSRRGPRAPYELLADELRRAIEAGELVPGTALPTCTELAGQHEVSVGTVNRAVALLRKARLVDSARGHRTTVRTLDGASS